MKKKRNYDDEYNVEYSISIGWYDPIKGPIYRVQAIIPDLNIFCVNIENNSERCTEPAFAILKQTVNQFIKRHEKIIKKSLK